MYRHKAKTLYLCGKVLVLGDLTGNRTRIARMKTWCPNR